MGEVTPKIPAVDDVEAQITACVGAISGALLTASDMPMGMLQPYVRAMAETMVQAYGWRQTEHIDTSAVKAPAWVTAGVQEETVPVLEQPDPVTVEPPTARVATAPSPPKKLLKKHLGVIEA